MTDEIIKVAPTVEEAIDSALEELGVQADAAQFEVLEDPPGGPAKVRVWLRDIEAGAAADEDEDDEDDEGQDDEEALPPELLVGVGSEVPELSEEELDKVADTAVAAIQAVLSAFAIEATIDEYEGDEGEIILDIVGGELGLLIGRHGKTLDAMQAVVSAITSRQMGFRYPVIVDVEGYRGRRREKLEDIAKRTADRVARQGRAVKLRPMSSYERRLIHMTLRGDRRVATGSEGEEPFRSVVVSPK
jgi:spoIIIJ-associated protein